MEERISELEYRAVEFFQSEEQKENRMKKSEVNLRDLWDTMMKTSIHIIGIPEGEERKGQKAYLKK